jgi:hypothetical protein
MTNFKYIFIFLMVNLFLFSCKKETSDEGFSFTLNLEHQGKGINFESKSFLFLIDENGTVVKEAEVLKDVKETTLTAKSGINYSVALFSPLLKVKNKKIYGYKFFHNVPNGAKWDLAYTSGVLEGNRKTIITNCIFKNVPSYDSLIIEHSFYNAVYNSLQKEVKCESNLSYYDLSYVLLREHKDSSFKYAFYDRANLQSNTKSISFDYNKMKKTSPIALKIKKNASLRWISAELPNGQFPLYEPSNWPTDSILTLFLPQEPIINYNVIGFGASTNYTIRWHCQLTDLSQFGRPNIEITKNANSYAISSPCTLVCHQYVTKNDNFQVNYEEWIPYDNKFYPTATPQLPKSVVKYVSGLNSLPLSNEFIRTFSFKDKSIDYNTYMNKLLVSNYFDKEKFDDWIYKAGLIECFSL